MELLPTISAELIRFSGYLFVILNPIDTLYFLYHFSLSSGSPDSYLNPKYNLLSN